MILLSDAMILMDMGYVNGLDTLVQIAPVEVLDVVLQECEHTSQPGLVTAIRAAGIRETSASAALALVASKYCSVHDQLSMQDALCLHYAMQNARTLLTNEKHLRNRCEAESVSVHGTIWIIEQAHQKAFRSKVDLSRWLAVLAQKERRLPKSEVDRLSRLLQSA